MTSAGNEPLPELTTERVRGGRRAALVAALAAVLVVGTLVWKPWDADAPASPPATQPTIARASATPPPSTYVPRPATAQAQDPSPPVTTTPFDPGPQFVEAPDSLGSVAFYPNEGPAAWCIYKAGDANRPPALSVIVVEPPVIVVGDGASAARLRAIRWHFQLESNTQDKLFESEWSQVADSQSNTIDRQQFGFTKPISLKVPVADSITVFRTPLVIDWLGAKGLVLASQRVVPGIYGVLGATNRSPQPGSCPTTM